MGYIHTNQYGKDEVKKIIFVFLKLYAEAIQQNDKMALDIITAFIKGHPENQETEKRRTRHSSVHGYRRAA